jgi:hypothetical protein
LKWGKLKCDSPSLIHVQQMWNCENRTFTHSTNGTIPAFLSHLSLNRVVERGSVVARGTMLLAEMSWVRFPMRSMDS